MNLIIVGGGKTGSQLAMQLISAGHQVKVIEDRPTVLERLQQEMPEGVVIAGDGSAPSVLEAAGIHSAQVLAAVTGDDEANLVITSLARFEFKVPRIIARVNTTSNFGSVIRGDSGNGVHVSQSPGIPLSQRGKEGVWAVGAQIQ